jgi:hypothetical protein
MPMWNSASVSMQARRSSSVTRMTFSSWSRRVMRSRCCQCQSFHWASGASFQAPREPGGKRARMCAAGRTSSGASGSLRSCLTGSPFIRPS